MDAGIRVDREAEVAVLGEVLLDNDVMHVVEPLLTEEDFYFPAHGLIYGAMLRLARRQEPIDIVTLSTELKRSGRYNVLGGPQMLGELTDAIPTTAHAEAHARLVVEAARVRRLRDLGAWLVSRSADPSVPAEALEAEALSRLAEIGRGTRRNALRPQAEVVLSLMDRMETIGKGGVHYAVTTTGLRSVDRATGGARAGELIVIGGRPSMGKTAYAEGLGTHVGERCRDLGEGVVLWFSEEMPGEELLNRRIAGDARVNSRGASAGVFTGNEFERYTRAANEAAGLPIFWHDEQRVSMRDIAMIARRAQHQHGRVALVVVDYLQRLAPMNPDPRTFNKTQDVGAAAKEAKTLARELRCPVVLLSQLNRELEKRPDKRPVMSDLRDSGEIEQEADIIVFLYRECVYDKSKDPREAEFILGKMRGGAPSTIPLIYDGERTRFLDPEDTETSVGIGESAASVVAFEDAYPAGDDGGSDDGVPFGEFRDDYTGGYPITSRGGDAE